MKGWNAERLLRWASGVAVLTVVLAIGSWVAPGLLPHDLSSPLAQVLGFATFGLCVAGVATDGSPGDSEGPEQV